MQEDYKIRFKLTETEKKRLKSGLKDVGVLVFLSPGTWQQRQIARSVGDGIYEVTVNVPETGVYLVFVESPSQRRRISAVALSDAPREGACCR